MERHKQLGCRPSITIDKHPCDALPILLCPFLFISFFCWCKGTTISKLIQIYIVQMNKLILEIYIPTIFLALFKHSFNNFVAGVGMISR